MSDDKFLSRTEVAEMFGVSAYTVTRWAREGKIPSIVTPGGQFRFPKSAILQVVAQNTQKTDATKV